MFYVLDENHNLVEAYDKEGVLAVLAQAIADGSLSGIVADSAFVTQLKCCVGGATHKMAFVSQAKYNELEASGGLLENCMYYITDDTKGVETDALLNALSNKVSSVESWKTSIESGSKSVPNASYASSAGSASSATNATKATTATKATSLTPVSSGTVTVTSGVSEKIVLEVGGIYLITAHSDTLKTTTSAVIVHGGNKFKSSASWGYYGQVNYLGSEYASNPNCLTFSKNDGSSGAVSDTSVSGSFTIRKIGSI